jgi:hypothetical protein
VEQPDSDRLSEEAKPKSLDLGLANFDLIGEWRELLSMSRRNDVAAAAKDRPASPETNKWLATPGPDKNTDKLTITADYSVSQAEFYKQNPLAPKNLDKVAADARFKVKHPTTGEIDDGWRLTGHGKGDVRLQRQYSMEAQSGKHDGLVESLPGVPGDFTARLEKKLQQLPNNVVENLRQAGYKIIAAPTIVDAMPGLKGLSPRGWPEETTFDDSDGTHDNVSKRIIAPMRVKYDGQWGVVERPEVVVHQIGHALDFHNGFLSSQKEFVAAFNKDMSHGLLNKRDPIIKYFSQPDGVGRQEAFATIFGLVLTGPENETDRQFLEQAFPHTIKAVKEQIRKLPTRKP